MRFAEEQVGGYRIYAAALEVPGGVAFQAGVVVRQFPLPTRDGGDVFRDEWLDDGRTWMSPDEALTFALEVGRAALRSQELFARCMRST